MDEIGKGFTVLMVTTVGHVLLWGSLIIGFLNWTYSMGFFRASIMGLFLIGVGQYLELEWNLK